MACTPLYKTTTEQVFFVQALIFMICDLSLYQILPVQWFSNTTKLGQSWKKLLPIPVSIGFSASLVLAEGDRACL